MVNSNKNFSAWVEIFGAPVAEVAMVDRFGHCVGVTGYKGASRRLRGSGRTCSTGGA